MKVRAVFFCTALVLSVTSATDSMGQDTGVTQGNLVLRDSPPSGLFYRKGHRIGTIPENSTVTVVERKDIPILFDIQEWLRVVVEQATENGETQTGWVYNGKHESSATPYVRMDGRS